MALTDGDESKGVSGFGLRFPVGTVVYVWNDVKGWVTGELLGCFPSPGEERYEILVDGLPGVYDAKQVLLACPRARQGVVDVVGTRSGCRCVTCRSNYSPFLGLDTHQEAAFLDNIRVRYVFTSITSSHMRFIHCLN